MITDRGLAALRIAATINHLYPMVTTRLRADGRTVARVGAPRTWSEHEPDERDDDTRVELSPCGFRAATAGAWAQHRSGRRLRLLHLDTDPLVDVAAGPGDEVWPSGIIRVRTGGVVVYAFGTFLGPDRCRCHGRDLLDAGPAPDGLLDLVLQRDTDTDVTVVSAEVDPEAWQQAEHEVLDLLEALLARFAAVELLDELAPEPTRP